VNPSLIHKIKTNPIFQAILLEIQRLCPVVPLGVPHGTTKELFIDEKWLIPKGQEISEGNCPQFL
jgi:cytochrome P450